MCVPVNLHLSVDFRSAFNNVYSGKTKIQKMGKKGILLKIF